MHFIKLTDENTAIVVGKLAHQVVGEINDEQLNVGLLTTRVLEQTDAVVGQLKGGAHEVSHFVEGLDREAGLVRKAGSLLL